MRERFVDAPAPSPLRRLYYTAADGWRAPLFHLPARPGGAREPVILAHGLGMSGHAFRYGRDRTLAGALVAAGFDVYLLAHRGDRDAVAPRPRARFDFDDVLVYDVPAALDRVCADSGYPRAAWVGHGLGGQLGLVAATREPRISAVAALCAPVRFTLPASELRRLGMARALLPGFGRLPVRMAARAATPWVDRGARLRGALAFTTDDIAFGILRQVAAWVAAGSLVDRTGLLDYRLAFADAGVPLLVVTAGSDRVAPEADAVAAVETWGCDDTACIALPDGWNHLDVLLAPAAAAQVYEPLVRWLDVRRRAAWCAA